MCSLCGAKCEECTFSSKCKGCVKTCGNPFGSGCIAADYIKVGGIDEFDAFKKQLCEEFNNLHIDGLPNVGELYCLAGFYVNLEYPLANGQTVKFLDDNRVYLGTQLCNQFDDGEGETCFGLVADKDFLLVCEYGENGSNPRIVMYKTR